MKRVSSILRSLLVVASITLSACAPAAAPPADIPAAGAPAEGKTNVGLSFSDFAIERWIPEADLLRKQLEEMVSQALVQGANYSEKLQNDQCDNVVVRGHSALINMAEDGYDALERLSDAVQAALQNSYLVRLLGL